MSPREKKLSERHTRIMEFLNDFQEKRGYSPSIREIGDFIGVKSTSLVDYYLRQLEDMGYISRDGHVSRSICVLKPAPSAEKKAAATSPMAALREMVSIPLLGRIVASAPIPMPQLSDSSDGYFGPDSSVDVARSMLPVRERPSELFALEVDGDSMIDAMINDGDIVILRPAVEANNGDMVAVWLDDRDETTLKYFYREGNRVRLQPANPTMAPIYIDNPRHLRVMGKVVMVIRQVGLAA
ncbi:MAG TPA: transcriptional repressor LexA [Anaerolineaceae bacterium]|jgi:repressor LexA|nr:repressor LexA [Anaerolineaceae bacterium]HNZ01493.1 transcriptional repressor LexA [Anaerolineaceae bacterium]HOD43424.1 transcriptional repressor LexA [Anaerolineaceae bacterium]HOH20279.1 transcriptional repressor LexA [Anaerolineaceae bacterium]HOU44487.1 transcriptional repressor LexA [Anaerolineaceae bacterium]